MQTLEPIAVSVALLSLFIDPYIASMVGPYAVIVIASTIGAAWSLGNEEEMSIRRAMWFFTKINFTAILVTVLIASVVSHRTNFNNPQYLLAPVALSIGIIGNRWSTLGEWLLDKYKAVIDGLKGK